MTDTCKLCGTFLNSKTVCPAEEEQCPYHNRKPHFSSLMWRPSKNDMDKLSAEEFYKGMYESIYKALCGNHMTGGGGALSSQSRS